MFGVSLFTFLNSLSLPGLRVSAPDRRRFYFKLSQLPHPDEHQWVPSKPSREWSASAKDRLKRGLQNLHSNPDYLRLQDPFYAISQYIMHGEYSPKEVARAIRLINVQHPDWQL